MVLEFQSKLKGEFTGWSPSTIYELKNGTKWMLTNNKTSSRHFSAPRVEVYRDGEDYYLKMGRIEKPEKVRRID